MNEMLEEMIRTILITGTAGIVAGLILVLLVPTLVRRARRRLTKDEEYERSLEERRRAYDEMIASRWKTTEDFSRWEKEYETERGDE